MVNGTDILSDFTFNISTIISSQAIERPDNWLASFNALLGYWPVFTFLILFGVVLALSYRQKEGASDSESIVAAGFITTFIGILLFIIETVSGIKLLTWAQFVPIVVITGLAFAMHKMGKQY